jgi:CO/xanthine dehydrogenase Mo-binding subunit
MRGFGMPEIHWGIEQSIDQLAEEMGIDPVEFRCRNCVKTGDQIVTGMDMPPIDLVGCITKAAEMIQWGEDNQPSDPNKRRGKSIAIM